jgi:hypothetical protein
MDMSIISLSVSGIVALIQVVNFFETRSAKKEAHSAVFAKAHDVKVIFDGMEKKVTTDITELKKICDEHSKSIHSQNVDISVLKTQVIGMDKSLDHIIDTLDSMMDRINEER